MVLSKIYQEGEPSLARKTRPEVEQHVTRRYRSGATGAQAPNLSFPQRQTKGEYNLQLANTALICEIKTDITIALTLPGLVARRLISYLSPNPRDRPS